MKTIAFIISLFAVSFVHAQTAEDSVKAAVNRLFSAMKSSDAKGITESFSDSAILQTIARNKNGKLMIRNESVQDFAIQIGKLPKDSADERITFDIIKVDGPLAIVWTPYQFYYAGKFSHCGVNSFQLVRLENAWKIEYLIDTRRRTDCK